MSEFQKVQSARRGPTSCVLCGSHEGPFIDTNVNLPVYGQLNICASNSSRTGCIRQMGRLDGLSDPQEVAELTSALVQAQARIVELEDLLGNRKAPITDVLVAMGVR